MNKLISNTLLLTVICTLFAACGDDGDSTPVNTNPLGLDTTLVSPVTLTSKLVATASGKAWVAVRSYGWTTVSGTRQYYNNALSGDSLYYIFNTDHTAMLHTTGSTLTPYVWALADDTFTFTAADGTARQMVALLSAHADTLTLVNFGNESRSYTRYVLRTVASFSESLLVSSSASSTEPGIWLFNKETGWTLADGTKLIYTRKGENLRYVFYADHTGYSADSSDIKSHFSWKLTAFSLKLSYTDNTVREAYVFGISASDLSFVAYDGYTFSTRYFKRLAD